MKQLRIRLSITLSQMESSLNVQILLYSNLKVNRRTNWNTMRRKRSILKEIIILNSSLSIRISSRMMRKRLFTLAI